MCRVGEEGYTCISIRPRDLQLFCVGPNFVPNLIVILFNLLYPVFYIEFFLKVVCARECEDLSQSEEKRSFCG